MSSLRAAGILALVVATGACASTGGAGEREAIDPGAIRGRVFDGRTGRALTPGEVAAHLLRAHVILVGEQHASPPHHAVQREVIELAAALAPGRTAVGVEWLPRSQRLALAGFIAAEPAPSLEELRAAVRWDELWKHDLLAYAPVFEAARRLRLPIVPLNAEPGLTRFIARGGLEAVPLERRAELPPLTTASEAHRRWFAERMAEASKGHPEHAIEGEALERFYLAQLVWDETMAEAARRAALRYKLIVLAGTGHIERGLGIPARLGRLERLVIIPVKDAADAAARARDADFPEREADLLWVTPAGLPWPAEPP